MKISNVLMALTVVFGISQLAYADHHGEDCKHHAKQQGLAWADANQDGVVSKDEFTEAHKARSEKMFEKLDANKDGKIDEAERNAAKAKMGEHCKMKGQGK
ncbi:MAG: calcium-binding domain-containing protein [Betaproteobacteria bacterium HGW-Betaproteobacteria-22]|nr:MAG: calcium-binding domain-containing protein [Betaproteobacteria bacterium HGW-Betaproteobacteria-22]